MRRRDELQICRIRFKDDLQGEGPQQNLDIHCINITDLGYYI